MRILFTAASGSAVPKEILQTILSGVGRVDR